MILSNCIIVTVLTKQLFGKVPNRKMATSVGAAAIKSLTSYATSIKKELADIIIRVVSRERDDTVFEIGGGFIRDGGFEEDGGEWANRSDSDLDITVKTPDLDKDIERADKDLCACQLLIESFRCDGLYDEADCEHGNFRRLNTESLDMRKVHEREFGRIVDRLVTDLREEDLTVTNVENIKGFGLRYSIPLKRITVLHKEVSVSVDLCYRPTYWLDFDVNSQKWTVDTGITLPHKDLDINDVQQNIASRTFNVMWKPGWGNKQFTTIVRRIGVMEARGWKCSNPNDGKFHPMFDRYFKPDYNSDSDSC